MKHVLSKDETMDIARRACERRYGEAFGMLTEDEKNSVVNDTCDMVELGYSICAVDRRLERQSHLLFIAALWTARFVLFAVFYIIVSMVLRVSFIDSVFAAALITLLSIITIEHKSGEKGTDDVQM